MRWRYRLPNKSEYQEEYSVRMFRLETFLMEPIDNLTYNFFDEMDAFYVTRKDWKIVTKDFIGQIVQNIGGELE